MKKEYLFAYKFGILCIFAVWLLSLLRFSDLPELDDVPFADKWTHMVMYGGTCSILWLEHLIKHRGQYHIKKLLIYAVVAPDLMSGLLELLQEYATNYRSGDWWDFLANTVGVILAALLGWFITRPILQAHFSKA